MKECCEGDRRAGSGCIRHSERSRIVAEDLDSPGGTEQPQQPTGQGSKQAEAEPPREARGLCIALLLRRAGRDLRLAHRGGRLDYFADSRTCV